MRTSASLAKETISLVEAQFKKIKQPETRVVRYPNGKPLALNVLHKVHCRNTFFEKKFASCLHHYSECGAGYYRNGDIRIHSDQLTFSILIIKIIKIELLSCHAFGQNRACYPRNRAFRN